jgi:hypothetical protein
MDGNEGFQERIIPAEGTVGLLQLIAAKLAGMNVSADKVSVGAGGVTLRNGAIRAVLGELVLQGYGITGKGTPGWPSPTPEMAATPEFEAVWQRIKGWDINVPDVYAGYCGANGNHV